MNIINLLFPIIKIFEDLDTNELDIIAQNNFELAKELEGKPPMTAQQIKEYVKNKKDEKINL
jgi:hypothetical protein